MGSKKIRKKRVSKREDELYAFIGLAAEGTHGQPLGFGDFIRKLPDSVIQTCARDDAMLCVIALHAMLIVMGEPKAGVPSERMTDEALLRIKWCVINEHLRRIMMLRVRYPRDPFTEMPQLAWCNSHPFVQVLDRLPEADGDKLKSHILRTGDLTILSGHTLLLEPEQMRAFDERMTFLEKSSPELLAEIEDRYADAHTVAWTGDDMRG